MARPDRLSLGLGLTFLAAAMPTAALSATNPFEHGWWLVAYLALVGGVGQLLLEDQAVLGCSRASGLVTLRRLGCAVSSYSGTSARAPSRSACSQAARRSFLPEA
jgi:hypothetical protein